MFRTGCPQRLRPLPAIPAESWKAGLALTLPPWRGAEPGVATWVTARRYL